MTVTFLGIDLTDILVGLPKVKQQVSTSIIIEPETEISFFNKNDAFNVNSNSSIIKGLNVIGQNIKIEDDDDTIFDGYISRDLYLGDTYTVYAQSKFSLLMKSTIQTFEKTAKTPAKLAELLLESFGLNEFIDYTSFGQSDSIYSNNNVLCNTYINASDGVTLVDGLNNIAKMGVAKIYQNNKGLISFDVFKAYEADSLYTINASDMLDYPKLSLTNSKDIISGYSINYLFSGNVPATSGTRSNTVYEFDGGNSSAYQIGNIVSANYLGSLALARGNERKRTVSFALRKELMPLPLNQQKQITFADFGMNNVACRLEAFTKNGNITQCVFKEI